MYHTLYTVYSVQYTQQSVTLKQHSVEETQYGDSYVGNMIGFHQGNMDWGQKKLKGISQLSTLFSSLLSRVKVPETGIKCRQLTKRVKHKDMFLKSS